MTVATCNWWSGSGIWAFDIGSELELGGPEDEGPLPPESKLPFAFMKINSTSQDILLVHKERLHL